MIDLGALLARGCASTSRVGVGLAGGLLQRTSERLRASGCAVRVEPYTDARSLVEALRSGDLDAAVRGVLSSREALMEMKRAFGVDAIMRAAVMESGKPFILTPVGIDEGVDADSRLRMAEQTIRYFGTIGWQLRVGVLAKGRLEDSSRGSEIDKSIADGEMIASSLRRKGHDALHYAILVEDAVRDCDLILAPDGVSGNLMFRSLHFVGGAKAYGAPVVNLEKVFVDTSRAKEDFSEPVLLAAALSERSRSGQGRA